MSKKVLTIKEIFGESQNGMQSHGKLIKITKKIYKNMALEEFWAEFLACLKYPMVVYKREASVERTLEFVAKFAVSVCEEGPQAQGNEDKENEEEEEEPDNPLLRKLIEFLLKSHNVRDRGVRFRCCQMINKILNNMGESAQIDDDIFDQIQDCMMKRMHDLYPVVRVQAALALARLQDPTDKDCPVIKEYLFFLGHDPNPDVRRTVLTCIAPSTKTLPAILERCRDVKDMVRKQACQILAEKVHIKALSIAQRVQLLQDGLTDRSDMVKEACAGSLLQSWLRTVGGNILDLLICLDVEESVDTAQLSLQTLFKKFTAADLLENFDLLNNRLVIPEERLSCESVLYWKCLCQHLRALGDAAEDYLEMVLPTGSEFSAYLRQVAESMRGEEDVEKQMTNEFILQHLIELAKTLDLADEVGRRKLDELLHELLVSEDISHSLVRPLLECFQKLHTEDVGRIQQLTETISEIREPIMVVEAASVTAEEKRQNELKLAGVRVELNQLREELDETLQKEDYQRAAELKEKLSDLESSKATLLEETLPTSQEVRTEKNDPQTLLKCLTIASEMLQNVSLTGLNATLQTLLEALIVPGIQNTDPAVRNMAVKALGLCCQISKETARAHLLLILQVSQVDTECVQATALKVVFDLLHTFGIDAFEVAGEVEPAQAEKGDKALNESGSSGSEEVQEDEEEGDKEEEAAKIGNSLASILIKQLDNESSEMRTVAAEGLAKLLLSARISSAKLLSRLILLWYNPVTEEDVRLRHCLGTFFPVFAFAGRSNQGLVEEAFMPTLRTLFEAPSTSPLANINVNNVAELLVQLCATQHLVMNQTNAAPAAAQDNVFHDGLAVKICNEILKDPKSFNVRILTKILNMLSLTQNNFPNLKDLKVLTENMQEDIKDKQSLKALEKLNTNLSNYLIKDDSIPQPPEGDADVNTTIKTASGTVHDTAEEEDQEAMEEAPSVLEQPPADVTMHAAEEKITNISRKSKSQSIKTPATKGRTKKSTAAKSTNKKKNKKYVESSDSEMEVENSVFASPTPVRQAIKRKAKDVAIDTTRKNLDEFLSDSETQSETESSVKGIRSSRRNRTVLSDIDNETA